ncbi:MAG: NUDIX hydrolase [Anaerolineae bacterium]|nr:NUDIX hydrolase [Anaerolineae bacterium]
MRTWKTLSQRTVLDFGKFLAVETRTVELPDGQQIPDWPWVIAPDYVNVVAVTEQGRFLCFRQVKYAIQGTSLAPVGGYIDPGEEPLATAQRELLEETGHAAAEWVSLGSFPVDGNRGFCIAHLFLALGARPVAEIDADDLEEQQLLALERAEVETALDRGDFALLPWAAAVALALRQMDR